MEAPESLSGLEVEIHFLELMANGFYEDLGIEKVDFGDFEVGAFDFDTQQIEYEPYSYVKTSENDGPDYPGCCGFGNRGD